MSDSYESNLQRSLESCGLDLIVPDGSAFREALSLDGTQISSLSNEKLQSIIYTLSRYLMYLQLQYNVRSAKHVKAKRDYELALSKALVTVKGSKLTVKEKTAIALESDESLALLEELSMKTEGEEIVFKRTPDAIVEMINSLKRALGSTRGVQ